MDLSCQGSPWTDENCSVQNSADGLTAHVEAVTPDKFEIFYTNADGLHNKLNELKVLLQSDKNKPKIIAITEVKHKNKWNLLNSELNIEGYNLYNNDFTGNGRGVAIYVSDELYFFYS